jgi:molybdopterin-guanine dinucleotide biosynthesis protein A
MQNNFTGIILSGGKSTRMGENKALIKIEGIPIIQRIHNLFEKLFKEIIIVTDQKERFSDINAKVYSDIFPNRGVLAGIYTGLFFSNYQYAFCVACDMPFLKESVIRFLLRKIGDYDVIVPKTRDGLQPLHAIYSKKCLEPIKKIILQNKFKILDLYPIVRVKIILEKEFSDLDPANESFINVNTPEDLDLIRKRW